MASSDSLFSTLPQHIQNAIDDSFTSTVILDHAQARQRKSEKYQAAGEFVTDSAGGGFLVEDTEMDSEAELNISEIPFEFIPSALQRLELPSDDEEVLSVFKNAATGWKSVSLSEGNPDGQEKYVSRDDWRSVCAVLLEHRAGETHQEGNTSEMDEDEGALSDGYVEEQSSDNSVKDSSDEYQAGSSPSRVRRAKQSRSKRRAKSSSTNMAPPTSRQRQICLNAFSLFFPNVPPANLEAQKIKVSDLQRVSKLLGEKIKADEMLEMLDMFSTSADKAMDINDFTRMMIAVRLA